MLPFGDGQVVIAVERGRDLSLARDHRASSRAAGPKLLRARERNHSYGRRPASSPPSSQPARDVMAVSFVRTAQDVRRVGTEPPKNRCVAKVETSSAVYRAAEIIEAADGIMVARGDLGTSCDRAAAPPGAYLDCIAGSLPVITATDARFDGRSRPDQAEASDVRTPSSTAPAP
jgi:hypothetical protein